MRGLAVRGTFLRDFAAWRAMAGACRVPWSPGCRHVQKLRVVVVVVEGLVLLDVVEDDVDLIPVQGQDISRF